MEFLRFCLEIIRREAQKFNVGIKPETASQLTAANADDVKFDDAHNRCAFLYRCGTINLSLAKDCFSKFLSECNGIEYLMAKWKSDSCLTFCSLTKGPALDYIALLLSHEQCRILNSLIGNLRIISKHGAWRNTANIMVEIINEGCLKNVSPSLGTIEVIQGDPFNNFTEKVRLPINDSDIVMMIKSLNLQSDGYDQTKVSKAIKVNIILYIYMCMLPPLFSKIISSLIPHCIF